MTPYDDAKERRASIEQIVRDAVDRTKRLDKLTEDVREHVRNVEAAIASQKVSADHKP